MVMSSWPSAESSASRTVMVPMAGMPSASSSSRESTVSSADPETAAHSTSIHCESSNVSVHSS